MRLRKTFFFTLLIGLLCTGAFAASSPNYAMKQARLLSSGGASSSASYAFKSARIGSVFGGTANSVNYRLDATAIKSAPPDTTPPEIIITSHSDGQIVDTAQITLAGTIDGEPFSEPRTLTEEGANTLTKTASDTAGNSASVSITLYRYLATGIGPGGGTVFSPDGKVKLEVPPGALSAVTQINILPLPSEDLAGITPADHLLLSIAEFKPYYFVFNLPVKLTYTLSEAQVPGTVLQLGLYDPASGEIVPTGQYSVVTEDGYHVVFMLDHFSTYGALKSMVSSGAPIGSGVDIPLPDMFTGAFSHSVPITVSPGRKKMQPNLQLSYRSSNPNSWLGMGFSMNPGCIRRSTRLGPPSYIDSEDTYYYINDAGSTELVHLVDNLYQAKIESSFTKFYKESNDTWRVIQKDGMTLYFGQDTESKETAEGGTFSWYVTRVLDTNANFVRYNYTKDRGKVYLDYIDYTANANISISAPNRVEFILESREDVISSYISGSEITTAKRLAEIRVTQNSELVWRYAIEYVYSPDTDRSLISAVTQYSSDGRAFPSQTFQYQAAR
jgi:hypothetical protein